MKTWLTASKITCLVLVATVLGCAEEYSDDRLRFGSAEVIGIVNKHASISHLQGGISLDFGDKVLWMFAETELKEPNSSGESVLSNTAAWVSADQITSGDEFEFVVDGQQELVQLIPYNTEESQFNASNTERIVLKPLGGLVLNGIGYVYYEKLLITGLLSQMHLGVGVAQVDTNGVVTRLSPAQHSDPVLLWSETQYNWGQGAFLAQDGYLYVFSAIDKGSLMGATRAARVPTTAIADLAAYQYWNGFEWQANEEQAAEIFSSGKFTSVGFNDYVGKYLAFYNKILSNEVLVRTADFIEGEWGVEIPLFSGEEAVFFSITDVQQHSAYQGKGGKEVLISYASKTEESRTDVYLVKYEFAKD